MKRDVVTKGLTVMPIKRESWTFVLLVHEIPTAYNRITVVTLCSTFVEILLCHLNVTNLKQDKKTQG